MFGNGTGHISGYVTWTLFSHAKHGMSFCSPTAASEVVDNKTKAINDMFRFAHMRDVLVQSIEKDHQDHQKIRIQEGHQSQSKQETESKKTALATGSYCFESSMIPLLIYMRLRIILPLRFLSVYFVLCFALCRL